MSEWKIQVFEQKYQWGNTSIVSKKTLRVLDQVFGIKIGIKTILQVNGWNLVESNSFLHAIFKE